MSLVTFWIFYIFVDSKHLSAGLIAAIAVGCLVGAILICCWIGSLIDCIQHVYKYWCSCCHRHYQSDVTFSTVIANNSADPSTTMVTTGTLPPSYSSIFRNDAAFALEYAEHCANCGHRGPNNVPPPPPPPPCEEGLPLVRPYHSFPQPSAPPADPQFHPPYCDCPPRALTSPVTSYSACSYPSAPPYERATVVHAHFPDLSEYSPPGVPPVYEYPKSNSKWYRDIFTWEKIHFLSVL